MYCTRGWETGVHVVPLGLWKRGFPNEDHNSHWLSLYYMSTCARSFHPTSHLSLQQTAVFVSILYTRGKAQRYGKKTQVQLTQRQDGIQGQVSAPKAHAPLSCMIYDPGASVLSSVKWEHYTLYTSQRVG